MAIYRAPTSFLTRVKSGAIRCSGVLLVADVIGLSQTGGGPGNTDQVSLPLSSLDDAGRVINLGGATGFGGRPANATIAVEVDARFINLNRECSCEATPDLVPRLVALGFTAYTPVGASTTYNVPQAN